MLYSNDNLGFEKFLSPLCPLKVIVVLFQLSDIFLQFFFVTIYFGQIVLKLYHPLMTVALKLLQFFLARSIGNL